MTSPSEKRIGGTTPTAKWVVGTDGSDHALDALSWAAQQASGRDVTIDLVSAWQSTYPTLVPIAGDMSAALDINSRELATSNLEAAASRAAALGLEVETHMGHGTAAHVLLEASANAELLVVGQRGRGGFARLLLGSVSHQVACHANCPTVIVPGPTERATLERVVVGVDGSVNSLDALRWALQFAPETAEVNAISTWEPPYMGEIGMDLSAISEIRTASETQIQTGIDELEQELGCVGRTKMTFTVGHPGSRIVDLSADADLLVVGARGRSGITAALIGSTTTWIAHHPPCPTVVVAQRPDPELG